MLSRPLLHPRCPFHLHSSPSFVLSLPPSSCSICQQFFFPTQTLWLCLWDPFFSFNDPSYKSNQGLWVFLELVKCLCLAVLEYLYLKYPITWQALELFSSFMAFQLRYLETKESKCLSSP